MPWISKAVRTALRLRACMPGIPSLLSARDMADSDTPLRRDSSRTDQPRKPRAARIWALVMSGFDAN
jgi:hypothetical protein